MESDQMTAACPHATPAEISVRLSVGSAGRVVPEFQGPASHPGRITVSPAGDISFEHQPGRILVTMRIATPGWTWRARDTFAYAERLGGSKELVGQNHPDINHVALTDGDQTVTFCYRNRGTHRRSEYTAYFVNAGLTYPHDPIIRNGPIRVD